MPRPMAAVQAQAGRALGLAFGFCDGHDDRLQLRPVPACVWRPNGPITAHWGHEPSSGAPTFLSAWASAEVLADKNVGAPTARFMES